MFEGFRAWRVISSESVKKGFVVYFFVLFLIAICQGADPDNPPDTLRVTVDKDVVERLREEAKK